METLSVHVNVNVKEKRALMAHAKESRPVQAKKMTSAAVGIPARNVQFEMPDQESGLLYDDNLWVSSFLAMLSAVFPPGERFFVDSVRHYKDRVTDPKQLAEITGFMGQESVHGRQHDRLNAWFMERGFRTDLVERAFQGLSVAAMRRCSPSLQLAMTAMGEHFTAEFADIVMREEEVLAKIHPEILGLWMWHCLEELEHKHVAFDLHAQISEDAPAERYEAMRRFTRYSMPVAFLGWLGMVLSHPKRFDFAGHRRGFEVMFGKDGVLTRVRRRMGAFASVRFHPSQRDTSDIEEAWRERLFGESGELLHVYKNRDAVERAAAAGAWKGAA